jgi:hypothetical protein
MMNGDWKAKKRLADQYIWATPVAHERRMLRHLTANIR